MDPWIHGSMDPWIYGIIDPWIHGSMDPWIRGSMVPWIQVPLAVGREKKRTWELTEQAKAGNLPAITALMRRVRDDTNAVVQKAGIQGLKKLGRPRST